MGQEEVAGGHSQVKQYYSYGFESHPDYKDQNDEIQQTTNPSTMAQ